ncbi:MAG TPA: DUF2341 domain-containing protein, partial [Candidatus Omnitrophota bacterium]|nr:DUF2341 domain-containing protein [Candidatus Omnitrophota bacterium]
MSTEGSLNPSQVRQRKGFTLVEVSLFLALFSIMTLAAGSVTSQGFKALRKLKDRTTAFNLGRQYLEALGYNSTNFTISGNDVNRPELRINNVNYTVTMNVTDLPDIGEIKRYDIRVDWVNAFAKTTGSVRVSTFKSSYPDLIPAGRPITITNRESTALTNYQVLLTIDTASIVAAGHMRADGNDIRFYDMNGNTLPYWIEADPLNANGTTMNTATTRIWIKVVNIPVGESKIYMDYGNPIFTTPASDGNATFEFFDDFSAASVGTAKWTVVGGYCSISSGRLYVSGGSGNWNSGLYSKANIPRPFALEYTMYRAGGNYCMLGAKNTGTSVYWSNLIYAAEDTHDSNGSRIIPHEEGNNRGDYKRWIHANRWEFWKFDVLPSDGVNCSGGAQYYLGWYPQQYSPYYSSGYSTASPLKVGISNYNLAFYLDNVRVRKLAVREPIVTIDDLPGTVFSNRVTVRVFNQTGSALTEHQVLLTVDTTALINAGKIQSDCRDIRFMDTTGKRMAYWIEPASSDYAS